MIMTVHLHSYL